MEESIRGPMIRTRIHHKQTQRDGWTCDETTVEIVRPVPGVGTGIDAYEEGYHQLLAAELYACHQIGVEEARRRNAQEARE